MALLKALCWALIFIQCEQYIKHLFRHDGNLQRNNNNNNFNPATINYLQVYFIYKLIGLVMVQT